MTCPCGNAVDQVLAELGSVFCGECREDRDRRFHAIDDWQHAEAQRIRNEEPCRSDGSARARAARAVLPRAAATSS